MDERDAKPSAPAVSADPGIPVGSPDGEEPVVIGVREIVRFAGRATGGTRAITGPILRLLD